MAEPWPTLPSKETTSLNTLGARVPLPAVEEAEGSSSLLSALDKLHHLVNHFQLVIKQDYWLCLSLQSLSYTETGTNQTDHWPTKLTVNGAAQINIRGIERGWNLSTTQNLEPRPFPLFWCLLIYIQVNPGQQQYCWAPETTRWACTKFNVPLLMLSKLRHPFYVSWSSFFPGILFNGKEGRIHFNIDPGWQMEKNCISLTRLLVRAGTAAAQPEAYQPLSWGCELQGTEQTGWSGPRGVKRFHFWIRTAVRCLVEVVCQTRKV